MKIFLKGLLVLLNSFVASAQVPQALELASRPVSYRYETVVQSGQVTNAFNTAVMYEQVMRGDVPHFAYLVSPEKQIFPFVYFDRLESGGMSSFEVDGRDTFGGKWVLRRGWEFVFPFCIHFTPVQENRAWVFGFGFSCKF